jgi:hypothetical protein
MLNLSSNDSCGLYSPHMPVQVIFATERPATSRNSTVHVSLLEMYTLVVFLQVRSKTKSFRFTTIHCASMLLAMHHRNVFTAVMISIISIISETGEAHLYAFRLAKILPSERQEPS